MTDKARRLVDRPKNPVLRQPLTASLIFECLQDRNLTYAYCYNVRNYGKNHPHGTLSAGVMKLLIAKVLHQPRTGRKSPERSGRQEWLNL